jgi:signal transduction histidine kinase
VRIYPRLVDSTVVVALLSAIGLGLAWPDANLTLTQIGWTLALFGGFIVCYFLGMRPKSEDVSPAAGPWIVWFVISTLFIAAASLFIPSVFCAQLASFTMVWVTQSSQRTGVIASLFVGLTQLPGQWLGYSWLWAVSIELFAVGLAMIVGIWMIGVSGWGLERQRLLGELAAAQERLAAANHDAGVVAERQRLAGELHDTIAQSQAATVMIAERALRETATEDIPPILQDELNLIADVSRQALTQTRALVATNARLGTAEGLAAALERLATHIERELRISVGTEVDEELREPGAIPRELEVIFLRASQEGLSNVGKHAKASAAKLSLGVESDSNGAQILVLRIQDNGIGIKPEQTEGLHGFGLAGIMDRVRFVNGEVDITPSELGTDAEHPGTCIAIRIPAEAAETAIPNQLIPPVKTGVLA